MISPDRLRELFAEHLPAHLERQRWSGAQERGVAAITVVWLEVMSDDPLLAWCLVDADLADGSHHRYQLFIGGRPKDPWPEFLEGKDRQLVAVVEADGRQIVLYDALVDADLAIAVLHLTSPDTEVHVRRPIVLEHSNSSVVFDEANILKVFRKVDTGPSADVEITRVLAERGFAQVLAPVAELRRDGTDLAVLRPFLVGATEGWDLARTSVRDVLASRLDPEESGGDFAPEARRLGLTIAGLHLAMADAWGAEPGAPAAWVALMEEHLDELVRGDAASVDRARFDPDGVRARLAAARALAHGGQEIRIHGDLHLAQVIQVDAGWMVIDFEGEPARRRDEPYTSSSPLRDVAGILRSLHYAAATGLAEWDLGDDELKELLGRWETRNRDAFLDGYLAHEGIDALLPADPADRDVLLAAFELDKAVYELGYELGHRPDMASIPLDGIDRLVRGPVPT